MRRYLGYLLLGLPTLLWVGAVCYFEGVYLFMCVVLSALFHEGGHLLAFSALGLPSPALLPVSRGFRLRQSVPMTYRQELLSAMAGPLANLGCFFVSFLCPELLPWAVDFGRVSLYTAVCNLIPMPKMDGERILCCLLAPRVTDRCLYLVRQILSATMLYLGLFGSLFILWQTGEGFYPALLCLRSLFSLECPGGSISKNKRKREN